MNKYREYLVHTCIDCGPKLCEIDTKSTLENLRGMTMDSFCYKLRYAAELLKWKKTKKKLKKNNKVSFTHTWTHSDGYDYNIYDKIYVNASNV